MEIKTHGRSLTAQESAIVIAIIVIAVGVGFLGGMEYKKYQIRSAISGAFGDMNEVESNNLINY